MTESQATPKKDGSWLSAGVVSLVAVLTLLALGGTVALFFDRNWGGAGIYMTASLVGLGILYLGHLRD